MAAEAQLETAHDVNANLAQDNNRLQKEKHSVQQIQSTAGVRGASMHTLP